MAFVLVLLGALVYGWVDVTAKHRAVRAPQVGVAPATPLAAIPAVAPGPPPPPPIQGVPNQAIPKQGGLLAQVRPTGVRAGKAQALKAPVAGSQAEPETADAANSSEPIHTDTEAAPKNEEAKPALPEEAVAPAVADADASAEVTPGESRGKRMIKAVGRFLRIGGKKDVEPQPARPKSNQQ
ncbi:MAG TPA: hypothetical protein VGP79_16790 [Bryobacteraceae bacterium]|nr:hypothetical protein [Bryobacteraceae bacterium]